MEPRQATGDAGCETGVDGAAFQQAGQHPRLGQSAHPDGRLDRPARPTDEVGTPALDDVDDAEIHVRAEPPVQPHLVCADGGPPFDG